MDEFLKEIQNLNLKDVEERISKLDIEVRTMNDVSKIEEAIAQKKALLERKVELEKIEKRKADALAVNSGSGSVFERGGIVTNAVDNEKIVYRTAYLKNIRGLDLNEAETRAFTSAKSSAGAVIPTETADEIIKKLKQLAPMLNEITLLEVAGNVRFAVEGTKADAKLHTENSNITSDNDTLIEVNLSSYEITKLVQVSKTVATMSIDVFEAWLTDMIAEKIAEKITVYLFSGDGNGQPTGVNSITWDETNSVTIAKEASTSSNDVLNLIGLLPGTYDKNAKFAMSKKTLFTDFMKLQDNSKNKLVTNEGNKYFVYGYPVMLDDTVSHHEAYFGDFKKIVGNLSESINIVSGFDINTNSFKYLGCAMFDSKIAINEAFVKLIKATA